MEDLTESTAGAGELVDEDDLPTDQLPEESDAVTDPATTTNIENPTPAPFVNFRLVDPHGPNPGHVARELWRRIVGKLDNAAFRNLACVCRYFRQLLEPMAAIRQAALLKERWSDSLMNTIIKNDLADLLEVAYTSGKVPDAGICMVHALHYRAVSCIMLLNRIHPSINRNLDSVFTLDDLDVLKIALRNGATISRNDVLSIICYDAIKIFSYLVQLTNPQQLLSIELYRDPENLQELMRIAGLYAAPKIIGYLRSLGVPYYMQVDPNRCPHVNKNQVDIYGIHNWWENLSADYYSMTKRILRGGGYMPSPVRIDGFESRLVQVIQMYHEDGLPRFNRAAVKNLVVEGGKPVVELLHRLGYTDLGVHLENSVTQDVWGSNTVVGALIDPERDLYIAEVLKQRIPADYVKQCVVDEDLFRRLNEAGNRCDNTVISYALIYFPTRKSTIRMLYSLGYHDPDVLIRGNLEVTPDTLHFLLKQGCKYRDAHGTIVHIRVIKWDVTQLNSNELVELYEMGFRWHQDHLRWAMRVDNVNFIAAVHMTKAWSLRTSAILWAIAARAKSCFEYLIHAESLPYASQAFVYANGKRTNTLSDDIPVDWLCLAYYMPWCWLVEWIKERASPSLQSVINIKRHEWTYTWGLDKLIPPGWHDIRNFIASNLIYDGRARLMRALGNGTQLPDIPDDDD